MTDPVGVFDSGIGGLSVVRAIHARLPQQDIIYLADNEHFPFGEQSAADIKRWTGEGIERLAELGCQRIILACNTATTNALSDYKTAFPGLVLGGVEPLLGSAVEASKSKRVAVFATFATLASKHFQEQLQAVPKGFRVYTQAGYDWVRFAEAGDWANEEIVEDIKYYLHKGVDAFVLGSTHFAFLADTIRSAAGTGVKILEPAAAIADDLAQADQPTAGTGEIAIYASKPSPEFAAIAQKALGTLRPVEIQAA